MNSMSKMRSVEGMKGYDFNSTTKILPSFTLSATDLPAMKNWKVGGKYKLEIEVEQIEASKNEYRDNEYTARFRILKVKNDSDSEADKMGKKGYE